MEVRLEPKNGNGRGIEKRIQHGRRTDNLSKKAFKNQPRQFFLVTVGKNLYMATKSIQYYQM